MNRFTRVLLKTGELKIYDKKNNDMMAFDKFINKANLISSCLEGLKDQSHIIRKLNEDLMDYKNQLAYMYREEVKTIPTDVLMNELKLRMDDNYKKVENYDKLYNKHRKASKIIAELKNTKEELEKENNDYYKVFNCRNCGYLSYDWGADGDEYEVCDKGHTDKLINNFYCEELEKRW